MKMDILYCRRSMTISKGLKKWDIWYANVKFEDSNDFKLRPVLIYNETTCVVISFKMTSVDRGDNKTEYHVREWAKAGLSKPTSIRLDKVLRLQQRDFVRRIGRLSAADILQLELRLASRSNH